MIKCREKFSVNLDDKDQQSINNFMSLVKGETVTLSNLNITNNLTVNSNLKVNGAGAISKLNIVDNKIQFPEAGYELALGGDKWARTIKLNAAQGPGDSYIGGFAGHDLWCTNNVNIGGNTNISGHLVRNGSEFFGVRHFHR